MEVAEIVVANVLMLGLGAGLLPLLRLAATARELLLRLPLAYAVGVAGAGILASELAVVDLAVGVVGLALLTLGALALGTRRLRRSQQPAEHAPGGRTLVPAYALLGGVAVFLVAAVRLFAVKPLIENDGWALWGLRARALYDFGHPVAPIFTSLPYPGLQYPLLLPELEAIDFRFIGSFDGTLVHLQLWFLAVAFVGGAWVLLRPRVSALLLAGSLLALVTAPAFLGQLSTNSADVPLALFVALGVAALAAWLNGDGETLLPAAVLFLGAGAMTKNEGELFVTGAFVVGLLVAEPGRRRPLLLAAGATALLVLPWHLWLTLHDVTATTFGLSHLAHPGYLTSHWYRVGSARHQLLHQIFRVGSWALVPLLALGGIAVAAVAGRVRAALFAGGWLLACFGGLLCVYWASPLPLHPDLYYSADRTIDTLLVGGGLLVPVLLGLGTRRGATASARSDEPPRAAPAP